MKNTVSTAAGIVAVALSTLSANAASTAVGGALETTGNTAAEAGRGLLNAPSRIANVRNDELPMIAAGVQEFGLSGYIDWTDTTSYATQLTYAWFITDCFQFGLRAGVTGTNSDANINVGLFGEHNFMTGSKWVPFIGGGVNYKRLDGGGSSNDTVEVVAEAGVKYFLRSNMAISASIAGGWVADGPDGDDGFASRVNFGLRYYF